MTITYEKVGDKVYMVDSNNPLVYRNISGWDTVNAPGNATVQVGSDLYNTPENIQELKKAEQYFKKQEEEQKKREQIEASKSFAQRQAEAQAQVKPVPHVTSSEYSMYVNRIEELKDQGVNTSTAVDIATAEYAKKQKQSLIDKIEENTKKVEDAFVEFQRLVGVGWEATAAARRAGAMYSIPMDAILKRQSVELSKKLEEKMHLTAQNIPQVFGAPIVSKAMEAVRKIYKIKKETKGAPSLEEARIEKTVSDMVEQQRVVNEQIAKIATPISPEPKKIQVAFPGGGMASILVRIGTALWDFVSKNPKTIGATVSTSAIANAISQTAQTEGEKNQILWEIGQQNPQLTSQIAREIAQTKTNPFANIADIGKYTALGIISIIILYLLSKK